MNNTIKELAKYPTLTINTLCDRPGIEELSGLDYAHVALLLGRNPKRVRAYGDLRLLWKLGTKSTFHVPESLWHHAGRQTWEKIERDTEKGVLDAKVLVCSMSTTEHQSAAVVPLRWGSPRVLVLPCGIKKVLGKDLKDECFRAARLWRYSFDPTMDLVLSFSEDESGFVVHSDTVNRAIAKLAPAIEVECI